MNDLSSIPTIELAKELAERNDLMAVCIDPATGRIPSWLWRLRTQLGVVACVDGVAVRLNEETDEIEGLAIRRNDGYFAGTYHLTGGAIGLYKSIEESLRYHFEHDLGLEIRLPFGWRYPVLATQYAPQVDGVNRPDFWHDASKHCVSLLNLVVVDGDEEVNFGKKAEGIQEASGAFWFTAKNCPPESEWGANQREGFMEVLQVAEIHRQKVFDEPEHDLGLAPGS